MKVAYLHVLPLEYYPPATNTLGILARLPEMDVRCFSTHNSKSLPTYTNDSIKIKRHLLPAARSSAPRRLTSYFQWPLMTAASLARWNPDAIVSVEPHSALAAWLYYKIWRGTARLFIHHHEYYAPEDFARPGMRLLRAYRGLERGYLFRRAEWISQTNSTRLALLMKDCPSIDPQKFRLLPNYPPKDWVARARSARQRAIKSRRKRFVYLGSASFGDTYIREVVEWAVSRPDEVELHICGFNIAGNVWDWLERTTPENVTWERSGWSYQELPERLASFDIGLILYKGNTLNFVHNAPNKLFEYLACGLQVWFPPVMEGIRTVRKELRNFSLLEVDFRNPDSMNSAFNAKEETRSTPNDFPFLAESALAPLISMLQPTIGHQRRDIAI